MSSAKPGRCPAQNPEGILCTFPEGHDGDHQGVESQYRWSGLTDYY